MAVNKFNNICEKNKHQQDFDNCNFIQSAFPLDRRKGKNRCILFLKTNN